jgi:hypothetical protein
VNVDFETALIRLSGESLRPDPGPLAPAIFYPPAIFYLSLYNAIFYLSLYKARPMGAAPGCSLPRLSSLGR